MTLELVSPPFSPGINLPYRPYVSTVTSIAASDYNLFVSFDQLAFLTGDLTNSNITEITEADLTSGTLTPVAAGTPGSLTLTCLLYTSDAADE